VTKRCPLQVVVLTNSIQSDRLERKRQNVGMRAVFGCVDEAHSNVDNLTPYIKSMPEAMRATSLR
jgi:hypothetical protein